MFLGQYGEQQVAVKAVFGERRLGVRGEDDVEVELQERRERMVQLEALLMSLLSGHPNIVQTYKCLASWRDLQGQGAGQVQVRQRHGCVCAASPSLSQLMTHERTCAGRISPTRD